MHTKNFTHVIVACAIALAIAGLTSVNHSATADIISSFIRESVGGEPDVDPSLSAFGDFVAAVGTPGGSAMGGKSTVQLRVPMIRPSTFHGAASSSSKKLTPCAR